jgi:hypothetical protein
MCFRFVVFVTQMVLIEKRCLPGADGGAFAKQWAWMNLERQCRTLKRATETPDCGILNVVVYAEPVFHADGKVVTYTPMMRRDSREEHSHQVLSRFHTSVLDANLHPPRKNGGTPKFVQWWQTFCTTAFSSREKPCPHVCESSIH